MGIGDPWVPVGRAEHRLARHPRGGRRLPHHWVFGLGPVPSSALPIMWPRHADRRVILPLLRPPTLAGLGIGPRVQLLDDHRPTIARFRRTRVSTPAR